ncbi:MAG: glycosyltransferase [Desulfobulbaceae bacterium]|nr:glycosyltransferase [Desulfobulbaceae bacterium]
MSGREEERRPRVVVVTVSLNAARGLEETINSVISQTYPNMEFIVVDGGSTDNSQDVIDKYSDKITSWVSEPDEGVYDAMNKGVALGSGEWVIFMNAGDCFDGPNVVADVFSLALGGCGLVYGNHKVLYEDGFERLHCAGDVCNLWKGMIFSHQAVFVRMKLLNGNPFCLSDPIGADFKLLFNLYRSGVSLLKTDVVISKVRSHGLSDKYRFRSIVSHFRVVRRCGKEVYVYVYYAVAILDMVLRKVVKSVLPHKLNCLILKLKYRLIRQGGAHN